LPDLLAGRAPARIMADGAGLKQVVARHGFGPHGAGFVDSRRVMELFGAPDAPACRAQVEALVAKAPRLAFGYDELSAQRTSMTMVLELDRATADQLGALRVDVPGLSRRLPRGALFAFGVGLDTRAFDALAARIAAAMVELGQACDLPDLVDDGRELAVDLPFSDVPDGIRGGVVVVQDMKVSRDMPSDIEGYAVLASTNVAEILEAGALVLPSLGDLRTDGSFRTISAGPLASFLAEVQVAARDDALLVAAGSGARAWLEQAVAHQDEERPLLVYAYDVGRVMKIARAFAPAGAFEEGMMAGFEAMGLAVGSVHVGGEGLVFHMRMDMN
jgi:hypothetical protein